MHNTLEKISEREIFSDLRPKNFEMLNFYGNKTCFIWNDNRLVVVKYCTKSQSDDEIQIIDPHPPKLSVLVAPKSIKCICSYSERVFIICEPRGIYKISDQHKFALLSEAGIGLGCILHHVLRPRNNWLYLDDKRKKTTKQLFQLIDNTNCRCINGVIQYDLRQVLFCQSTSDDKCDTFCLVSSGNKLYKLSEETVEVVHVASDLIKNIVPIKKGKEDFGLAIITNANYVLVLLPDRSDFNKLICVSKVFYDGSISALTFYWASEGLSEKLLSLHTYGKNIILRVLQINLPGTQGNERVDIFNTPDDKVVISLKNHDGQILMLTDDNKLTEFNVVAERMETSDNENEFTPLRVDMTNGTNIIVDKLCDKAKELEQVNRKLQLAQNELQRVTIYSHKEHTQYSPDVRIEKTAGRLYLKFKFESLPQNAQIVVHIKIKNQKLFSSKFVTDQVTTLEIPLEIKSVTEIREFDMRIDLIATCCENQLWCILNNHTANSRRGLAVGVSNTQCSVDKTSFLTAKLRTLRNLIQDGNIDSLKLYNIKKSIRKDIVN